VVSSVENDLEGAFDAQTAEPAGEGVFGPSPETECV
jgi:hypothetical protein